MDHCSRGYLVRYTGGLSMLEIMGRGEGRPAGHGAKLTKLRSKSWSQKPGFNFRYRKNEPREQNRCMSIHLYLPLAPIKLQARTWSTKQLHTSNPVFRRLNWWLFFHKQGGTCGKNMSISGTNSIIFMILKFTIMMSLSIYFIYFHW